MAQFGDQSLRTVMFREAMLRAREIQQAEAERREERRLQRQRKSEKPVLKRPAKGDGNRGENTSLKRRPAGNLSVAKEARQELEAVEKA